VAAVRIVFLGAPGTGKGTQAQRLSESFGLTALSSGDTLRQEIRDNSAVGREAREYVESGRLVPDGIVTRVMLAGIDRLPRECGFVLDGFPRTVAQAESLEAGLNRRGTTLDAVIDFRMSDAAIIERIATRRVCSNCGRTYNVRFAPPAVDGTCDACGAPLTQRRDDSEDVVATRLATYRSQTAPLVEYYSRKGILRAVEASRTSPEVEAAVSAIVRELSGAT
jgi:adenylate kinase